MHSSTSGMDGESQELRLALKLGLRAGVQLQRLLRLLFLRGEALHGGLGLVQSLNAPTFHSAHPSQETQRL